MNQVAKLSIIIPTLNEGNSLVRMIPNIKGTIGLDNYEIIIINSGGTDVSTIRDLPMVSVFDSPTRLGAPQARNFGVRKSNGDYIMFADAHLIFKNGWGPKILEDLEDNSKSIITPCVTMIEDEKRRGFGLHFKNLKMELEWLSQLRTEIHEIPFGGAACMSVEKKVFNEIGEFDQGIRWWGGADYELSMRTWLLGFRMLCDPSIEVAHGFRVRHPYKVEWNDIHYNKIRIGFSHFNSERLTKYLRAYSNLFSNISDFIKTVLMNLEDKVLDRREMLFNRRTYTDDWFFQKFPMNGW